MFLQAIIVANLMIAAAQVPGSAKISLPLEATFPPRSYLVKARATATTSYQFWRVTPASVEIEHVYVGPNGLNGTKLALKLSELRVNFSPGMQETSMPVLKGEPIICWITRGDQGKWEKAPLRANLKGYPKTGEDERKIAEWTAEFDPSRMIVSRNFERGDISFDIAVTTAEVCEKVYTAGDKARFKVLDGFVRSGDSVKAAAALSLLLNANQRKPGKSPNDAPTIERNPKIADYVFPLTKDEAAPPRVQREADRLLLRNNEAWAASPERWKMYQRWAGGDWKEKKDLPWDASEERAVAEALAYAYPVFTLSQTLELGTTGLANPARSDRFKTESIRAAAMSLKRQDSREVHSKGFTQLANVIQQGRTPAIKIAAARLLVVLVPFTVEQRAYLENRRQSKLDAEITKEITRALMEK